MKSNLAGTLQWVGSAGLGAALMYLLDPEVGQRRRRELADATAEAFEPQGAVGHAMQSAREVAGSAVQGVVTGARTLAGSAAAAGTTAGEYASDFWDRSAQAASRTSAQASRTARRYWQDPGALIGRERRRSHTAEYAVLSAAASLAIGAGLMYLLDPMDGSRRRNLIQQKLSRAVRETGRFCRITGRHVVNRARGYRAERERIAGTVAAVRGVRGVDNQLESDESFQPAGIPRYQS